jgi:hypothetical protein
VRYLTGTARVRYDAAELHEGPAADAVLIQALFKGLA